MGAGNLLCHIARKSVPQKMISMCAHDDEIRPKLGDMLDQAAADSFDFLLMDVLACLDSSRHQRCGFFQVVVGLLCARQVMGSMYRGGETAQARAAR